MSEQNDRFRLLPVLFFVGAGLVILVGVLSTRPASLWGPAAGIDQAEQYSSIAEERRRLERSQRDEDPPGPGVTDAEIPGRPSTQNAVAFEVPPRKEDLEMYPCSDCHEGEIPNLEERELEDEHEDLVFNHGDGRLWCHNCHEPDDPGKLVSLKAQAIDLDDAYLQCGECHFRQQRDWYFGAHGKRIGFWDGPRRIYSCPECHDPHSPSIKPFVPSPPPLPRKGLIRAVTSREAHPKVWERLGGTEE
jgi:hypothetical protein